MLSALSQSESNMQMISSRQPIAVQYANFFYDVTLSSSRKFLKKYGSYSNTLHLLKHFARTKIWLVARKINNITQSGNQQFKDYTSIKIISCSRNMCRNLQEQISCPCIFIRVVISGIFACFWFHSSVNISADNHLKTVSPCMSPGIHFSSLRITRQFYAMLSLALQISTSTLSGCPSVYS